MQLHCTLLLADILPPVISAESKNIVYSVLPASPEPQTERHRSVCFRDEVTSVGSARELCRANSCMSSQRIFLRIPSGILTCSALPVYTWVGLVNIGYHSKYWLPLILYSLEHFNFSCTFIWVAVEIYGGLYADIVYLGSESMTFNYFMTFHCEGHTNPVSLCFKRWYGSTECIVFFIYFFTPCEDIGFNSEWTFLFASTFSHWRTNRSFPWITTYPIEQVKTPWHGGFPTLP